MGCISGSKGTIICCLIRVSRAIPRQGGRWWLLDLDDEVSNYRLAGILVTLIFMVLALASFPRHLSAKGGTAAIERQVAERTAALEIEIEERKRAEEISKLNEMRLETLVKLNHIANAPFPEIIAFALEEAIRLTGSTTGYIAFMDEDETVLTMHTWAKKDQQESLLTEKSLIDSLETTGLWSTAVRQRQTIITNDDAAPNPWEKGSSEGNVGVTRHLNVPIIDGENIVIVAGVGNKASDYDESDVRQLTLLMERMWRIIRRNKVKGALPKSEKKYRFMLKICPPSFSRLYGLVVEFFDPKIRSYRLYQRRISSRGSNGGISSTRMNRKMPPRFSFKPSKIIRAYIREYRIKLYKDGRNRWIQGQGADLL